MGHGCCGRSPLLLVLGWSEFVWGWGLEWGVKGGHKGVLVEEA